MRRLDCAQGYEYEYEKIGAAVITPLINYNEGSVFRGESTSFSNPVRVDIKLLSDNIMCWIRECGMVESNFILGICSG